MELVPIQTRVFMPPQDNLWDVIDESLADVRDGDVVLITSKVIAIHEGRCVPIADTHKEELVRKEAEYIYERDGGKKPFTIIHNALISSAGIDESNGYGYYILLPRDPYQSAREVRQYLMKRFGLTRVGVIITDSHSLPFRYGAMSISIGYYGFKPVADYRGKPDLFGRIMQYSSFNIVDSLAAASGVVSGECDESQPIVIARGASGIVFVEAHTPEELVVPLEDDIYRDLFRDFKRNPLY